jgi:PTS system nitrogen regulatory IIA component
MITADLIIADLEVSSKKQAFQKIAQEAANIVGIPADQLTASLLERERIGSTGIGNGVAIPHIKIGKTSQTYGILVRLRKAIDFDAIDGQPVDIVFMLLAPAESKTTQHLKTLAHVSRFLKDANTCAKIRATPEQAELAKLLADWIKAQEAA